MSKQIGYVKHINEDKANRIEFLLTNFDYFDGIDYLAKLFCEKYQMRADKKVEGIFFDFITLHANDAEYILLWHEDIGILIYSNHDNYNITQLETQLSAVIQEINYRLRSDQIEQYPSSPICIPLPRKTFEPLNVHTYSVPVRRRFSFLAHDDGAVIAAFPVEYKNAPAILTRAFTIILYCDIIYKR